MALFPDQPTGQVVRGLVVIRRTLAVKGLGSVRAFSYYSLRMHSKSLRLTLMISVLLITIGGSVYYFVKHPEVHQQLQQISLSTLVLLMLLYGILTLVIGLTLLFTMTLCNLRLNYRESVLLTMYTVVINFFGPLQSGPAFRGVYLKQKYGLKLKNYTLATFVYLSLYALFSGIFLLSGLLRWWLLALGVAMIGCLIWLKYAQAPLAKRLRQLHLKSLGSLAMVSFLQVSLMAVIYFTELKTVDPAVGFNQAIIYTGAANFALFVAITPGAIGFRETFLLFSRRLHHISASTIVAANIIDRSIYIILLLIMVALIFSTHAREQLRTKQVKKELQIRDKE